MQGFVKNTAKGFTLIEIIVVIVILGILASIALPSVFSWIQKSKAAEAFAALKTYKDQIEACVQLNVGQEHVCGITTTLAGNFYYGTEPPCTVAGAPPTCGIPPCIGSGPCHGQWGPFDGFQDYDIYAWPGSTIYTPQDTIDITRTGGTTTSPTIKCSGTGIYAGLC